MTKFPHIIYSIVLSGFISIVVGCSVDGDLSKHGQLRFDTPTAAIKTLIEAVKNNQNEVIINSFGQEYHQFLETSDKAAEQVRRKAFHQLISEQGYELEIQSDGRILVLVGEHAWPFPIPLVKGKDGWYFNTVAGIDEILNRRIGMNELDAIATLQALIDAQLDYASLDFDDDGVLEYAQYFKSNPEQLDGLYWNDTESDIKSPLSSFVADANEYLNVGDGENAPFKGYQFKILTRQGEGARGGSYDYIVGDNMVAGFAILAYPTKYTSTGIMSFMVNHEGKIHEKDLGENTVTVASKMISYNLDEEWHITEE